MSKALIAPLFGVATISPFIFLLFYSMSGGVLLSADIASEALFYIENTAYLLLLGCLGVFALGVSTAFLVSRYIFLGSGVFALLFVLPLAMPSYLAGYAYVWILQKGGFLATVSGAEFLSIDMLNIYGISFVFSVTLFPYVYILAKTAFSSVSSDISDMLRMHSVSFKTSLLKVFLPLAFPAIFVGVSLSAMEMLSDYGTVVYFGVLTFSVGIFKTWFGFGDLGGAAILALSMMLFVLLFFMLEMRYKKKMSFAASAMSAKRADKIRLSGAKGFFAFCFCVSVVTAGVGIPSAAILYWLFLDFTIPAELLSVSINSVFLSIGSAAAIVAAAFFIVYLKRLYPPKGAEFLYKLSFLGYATPGVIIAMSIVVTFGAVDSVLPFAVLGGGFFALVTAYAIRYFAASVGSVESGFAKIDTNIDDTVRMFTDGGLFRIGKVYIPMTGQYILSAFLIVYIDIAKELPATLLLRPFNFDTLSVKIYGFAGSENIVSVAPYAAVLLVGTFCAALAIQLINTHKKASVC